MTSHPQTAADLWQFVRHLALEHDQKSDFDEGVLNLDWSVAHFLWDDTLRFHIKVDHEGRASVFSWSPDGEDPYHVGVFTDPLVLMAALVNETTRRSNYSKTPTTRGNHDHRYVYGADYVRDQAFSRWLTEREFDRLRTT